MKNDHLVTTGKVTEVHGNLYDVALSNGMTVRAYRGGKVLQRDKRPTIADEVELHISVYDMSLAIIKRILSPPGKTYKKFH